LWIVSDQLVLEIRSTIHDVPYGDCFIVEARWIAKSTAVGCHVTGLCSVYFTKSTMWKKMILSSTVKQTQQSYASWATVAQQTLRKRRPGASDEPEVPLPGTPTSGDKPEQGLPFLPIILSAVALLVIVIAVLVFYI
jgi:hypothetical protein